MIDIRFDKLDDTYALRMQGHADGERTAAGDLVCCAASMLAYTLAQRCMELEHIGLCRRIEQKLDSGDALIVYEGGQTLEDTYMAILTGLRLLEHQHPASLRLTHGQAQA